MGLTIPKTQLPNLRGSMQTTRSQAFSLHVTSSWCQTKARIALHLASHRILGSFPAMFRVCWATSGDLLASIPVCDLDPNAPLRSLKEHLELNHGLPMVLVKLLYDSWWPGGAPLPCVLGDLKIRFHCRKCDLYCLSTIGLDDNTPFDLIS